MKALNAKVNWMEKYANEPHLEILVDRIPSLEELLYDVKDEYFYLAEKDGYVRFFYYKQPDEGYAGHHFHLRMKDGSEVVLKGPWSSNSGTMNRVGFTPSIEASLTDEPAAFERGYTFKAGAITVDFARKALARFVPDVSLERFDDYYWTCGLIDWARLYDYVKNIPDDKFKNNRKLADHLRYCMEIRANIPVVSGNVIFNIVKKGDVYSKQLKKDISRKKPINNPELSSEQLAIVNS